MSKTKTEHHADICMELNALYDRKNHDYGDSFHQTFIEEGFAMSRIRLADKFNRFKTLSRNGDVQVKDESIRDTLIDLANYAIMTIMEMEEVSEEEIPSIMARDVGSGKSGTVFAYYIQEGGEIDRKRDTLE